VNPIPAIWCEYNMKIWIVSFYPIWEKEVTVYAVFFDEKGVFRSEPIDQIEVATGNLKRLGTINPLFERNNK
jgi:hypothetical protein